MLDIKEDNLLIICPNEEKLKILDSINKEEKLYNIKFMTKKEYLDNYYFSYYEKALIYIMKKYKYKLDVVKALFKYLYIIDENINYDNDKLKLLKEIKIDLINNNLLIYNPFFKDYISNYKIIVKNYYDLDLYEEKALNYKIELKNKTINNKVIECNTLEEEVNYVALEIIKLLEKNIDINKIYLTNISNEYLYTIKKIFSYYKIPINIDLKNSIYSTKVVQEYLNNEQLDLEDSNKLKINKYLVSTLNKLVSIKDDSKEYKDILIDKLKNTYIKEDKLENAINLKDLYNEEFLDDEYVFLLGFNQDILPKLIKDTDYITDNLKDNIDLYKTVYLNKRSKDITIDILSNIKNLFISYKLTSPFNTYYKSSLIADLSLEISKPPEDLYIKSNLYNKLRLSEALDLYNLYGEKKSNLSLLYSNYQIPYNTYSNTFKGINNDKYLENIPYPLKLSYTSLNAYSECKFKYYIKYVLKLDQYEDTFQAFIGSLYHNILSLYRKTNFSFEQEYNKYLEKRNLSLKEKLLLIRIKDNLKELLEIERKQDLITGYDDAYFEKKIDIELDKKVSTIFTGTIDKIMYYEKIEDTYFSIVDYKTGNIDTNIEPIKYGLHMQLPVYLYLINYSNVFKSPITTGIYYQNILFDYPTYDLKKDLETIKNDNYKLQGYSIEDPQILERFDPTYEKSEYIKSMAYTEDKGFSRYSKVINNDTIYDLLTYTKKYIDKTTDKIIEGDFEIDPKIYDKKNISCMFCKFNDLCYMKDKDLNYLDKVEDLSFLGGDDNA